MKLLVKNVKKKNIKQNKKTKFELMHYLNFLIYRLINQTRNFPIITVKFLNHKQHENRVKYFSMTNGRPKIISALIFYLTQLENQYNASDLHFHLINFSIGTRPIAILFN